MDAAGQLYEFFATGELRNGFAVSVLHNESAESFDELVHCERVGLSAFGVVASVASNFGGTHQLIERGGGVETLTAGRVAAFGVATRSFLDVRRR